MQWLVYLIVVGLVVSIFSSSGKDEENVPQNNPSPYYETADVTSSTQLAPLINIPRPLYSNFSENSYNDEELEASEEAKNQAGDLRSRTEDLNWEINRLKRNADSYDAEEFTSKLRRLQYEAEDISSEAGDLGADDASSALEDTSWQLQRLRRDIEDEDSYFYREREDEVNYGMRKSEWSSEEASSYFDDFSSGLDDY